MRKHTCLFCGKEFKKSGSPKFCSRGCKGEQQKLETRAHYNESCFDVWGPEMAYALGLMYSDGYLAWKHKGWCIRLRLTDPGPVYWFHSFLGCPRKIYIREPKNGGVLDGRQIVGKKKSVYQ